MWRHAFVKERYRIPPRGTAGRRIYGNARAGGAALSVETRVMLGTAMQPAAFERAPTGADSL